MKVGIALIPIVSTFLGISANCFAGSASGEPAVEKCLVQIACKRIVDTSHSFSCSSDRDGNSAELEGALLGASTDSSTSYGSGVSSGTDYSYGMEDDTAQGERVLNSYPDRVRFTLIYKLNGVRKTMTHDWVAGTSSSGSTGGPAPSCLDEAISAVNSWKDQLPGMDESCKKMQENYEKNWDRCSSKVGAADTVSSAAVAENASVKNAVEPSSSADSGPEVGSAPAGGPNQQE